MKAGSQQSLPSRAEFHHAITTYGDRWYSACLRITRNPDRASEAVQDALLNAWRKRRQFQHGSKLETWIYRIAVNSALQLLRTQHPERWTELPDEVAGDITLPEQVLDDYELGSELERALTQLSDMERVCFLLKHAEQWRLHEIADELETSLGTVKQAVFRAVKKLRTGMINLRSVS